MSSESQKRLKLLPWSGNVRELRNYVEQVLLVGEALSPDHEVAFASSEPVIDCNLPYRAARTRWIARFEHRYLKQLLLSHDNNVSAAAKSAGVDRVHLHRLLSKAGLR